MVSAREWELPCQEQAVDHTTEPAPSEGPLQPLPLPRLFQAREPEEPSLRLHGAKALLPIKLPLLQVCYKWQE